MPVGVLRSKVHPRLALAVIFCTSILVSGCASFEAGYTHAQTNPIHTMNLEELEHARRSVGLRDSEYYREKRVLDGLKAGFEEK